MLTHARALLTGGGTAYLDADLRDTGRILKEAAATLDFTQPIAIMLIAVLHCIPDEDDPAAIVGRLIEAVPPGSYLALSHPAIDIHAGVGQAAPRMNKLMNARLTFRTFDQVSAMFEGLELVEPGVVRVPEWRPATDEERANPSAVWGGVARKS